MFDKYILYFKKYILIFDKYNLQFEQIQIVYKHRQLRQLQSSRLKVAGVNTFSIFNKYMLKFLQIHL